MNFFRNAAPQIAPYLIVLFAFTIRITSLDLARYSHDSAIPFSYGIRALEAIADGRWDDFPVLSFVSGVRVQNPVGASYFWAIVALFSRSIFTGSAISVLLNVLAVAMTFDLGRKLFGRIPGLVAALLMATSIYSIYVSRTTWIQGQLEFCAVGSAWFILIALKQNNPKRLLLGFIFTAFAMQFYLASLALIAPAFLVCAAAFLRQPSLWRTLGRPFLIGLATCIASITLFGVVLLARGNESVQDFAAVYTNEKAPPPPVARTDRRIDPNALVYALQIAGSADFDFSKELLGFWLYLPSDTAPHLNRAYVIFISLLVLMGSAWAVGRSIRFRHKQEGLLTLIWFGWAIVLPMLLVLVLPRLEVRPQYMLLTTPGGYLLAGAAVLWRRQETGDRKQKASATPVSRLLSSVFCLLALLNSVPRVLANYNAIQQNLFIDRMDFLPIGPQLKMAQQWRTNCVEIANPQLQYWLAAAFETAKYIRHAASQNNDEADVWQVRKDGGTCASRLGFERAPVYAETLPLPLTANTSVNTYRSKPIDEDALAQELGDPNFKPIWLNLDWTLISVNSTPQAKAGEEITVTQVWRIDNLPNEPYGDWYFALFVHLVGKDGAKLAILENGHMIRGGLWRPGDYILNRLTPTLPQGLAPGEYELQISLFDGRLRKNAVYFYKNDKGEPMWEQPIVAMTRTLTILP
jgi:4-amino-4-deoxy-L-arabinose transferase-like glycosyltransferase